MRAHGPVFACLAGFCAAKSFQGQANMNPCSLPCKKPDAELLAVDAAGHLQKHAVSCLFVSQVGARHCAGSSA